MCKHGAVALVKTIYGWFYLCSYCMEAGHMPFSEYSRLINGTQPRQCECENIAHTESGDDD